MLGSKNTHRLQSALKIRRNAFYALALAALSLAVSTSSGRPRHPIAGSPRSSTPARPASAQPAYPLQGRTGTLLVREEAVLTDEQRALAASIADYLSAHHIQGVITSGLRSGERQLGLIKEKIARAGMMGAFPGLAAATLQDANIWAPAWHWLKVRRIPVDPPAGFMTRDGNTYQPSLHTRGLALDMIGGNLTTLAYVLLHYANDPRASYGAPLRITALTRERDCVHLSLAR